MDGIKPLGKQILCVSFRRALLGTMVFVSTVGGFGVALSWLIHLGGVVPIHLGTATLALYRPYTTSLKVVC